MFIYFIVLSWLPSIHRSNRLLNRLMCRSNQCDVLNRTGAANEVITFTFTAFIIKYFSGDKLCLQQHVCWINEASIEITILKSWAIIYLTCMQQSSGYLIRLCTSDCFWVSVLKRGCPAHCLYDRNWKLFSFQAVSEFSYIKMAWQISKTVHFAE